MFVFLFENFFHVTGFIFNSSKEIFQIEKKERERPFNQFLGFCNFHKAILVIAEVNEFG